MMRENKILSGKIKRSIISVVFLTIMSSPAYSGSNIKRPNVSGQFYDSDPKRLSVQIDRFFTEAEVIPSDKKVEIIMSPHAGYIYCGGVAAYGYKAASKSNYKTIVILAPSHHVGFDGISVWNEGGFQTPLGVAQVDEVFAKAITASNENFYFEPRAFQKEHSLEVQIPFLQKTFEDFKIVPIVMGQPQFSLLKDFAETLNNIIGSREDVLIVVSTDLSHYHAAEEAKNIDLRTIDAVKNFDIELLWQECQLRKMEMCGSVPVTAALLYARRKGLTDIEVLRYAHSGDVSGDNDRVVGYTSIVIYGKDGAEIKVKENVDEIKALTPEQKQRLLDIARQTVETYVKTGKKLGVNETDSRLMEEEGAFVTIHKKGMLRGCIGNIIGRQPLYLTVRDMAIAAASNDPRFPPVESGEIGEIDIEISVLSKPRVIQGVDEIRLGTHGVIVSQGAWHHGVFLPQVATDTGWSKEEFLSQLCFQKAHLPADAWKDPETKIEIFSANVFSEKESH